MEFPILNIDTIFDLLFSNYGNQMFMNTNVKDTYYGYSYEIYVPGVELSNIKVSVEDKILTVKVSFNSETKEKYSYYQDMNDVSRQYRLNDDVDTNTIKAKLEDNVLTISMKKVLTSIDKKGPTIF